MVAPGDAFQQYFWGDKNMGYDVLLSNMKQGVTATKELHELLRERANYEEAFSKSLRRLSDRASAINTVGSFLPVWVVIKKYIENMSQIHVNFSSRFKELCHELNIFLDAGSKAIKCNRENADIVKTSNSLVSIKNALEHVNKCKKAYQQKHKELVETEETLTKAGNITTSEPKAEKEHEKIQQKFVKCQDLFVTAENTYKGSIERYNKVQEEYNENMIACCKFFGEVEQTHLVSIVDFAKRFGDIETDLIDNLKKNCETILGGDSDEHIEGLVGFSPENLIELLVEDKKTGFEMAPAMTPELLTIRDCPIQIIVPKPLEKNSDSGSVNSLPNVPNASSTNINTMTLAMSNVSIKVFKKMLKSNRTKKPPKTKENSNEGDSKSLDSKNSHEENSDNVSVSNTSEHSRCETEFYERHGVGTFFSSDDDEDEDGDSDGDGLTAKVKTIKIRNAPSSDGADEATEEQLRKATESLTLSCLSPSSHRNRSITHNPHLFSAYSHSMADLPVSPDPQPRLFPMTFDTPRAKSVSGNISFPASITDNTDNTWAVFDDSFKAKAQGGTDSGNVLDLSPASWSTPPPTKRILFDELKINKKDNEKDSPEDLFDLALPVLANSTSHNDAKQDIEDLLSITVDDNMATTPNSDYLTPESSPTNHDELDGVLEEEEVVPVEEGRKGRLNSLIEFSPVRLGSQDSGDPLSSTQRSEDDTTNSAVVNSSKEQLEVTANCTEHVEPAKKAVTSAEEMVVEDSKLLSVVGKAHSLDESIGNISKTDTNGMLHVYSIKPTLARSTPMLPISSDIPADILQPTLTSVSTENVAFSSSSPSTMDDYRTDTMYPIAIAVIETAHAIFKSDNVCTSKIEGELIMSLPYEAAAQLSTATLPPPLKMKLLSTITPSSFIVNRQIFSLKPPSIRDMFELNMNLLQDFLRKRLAVIGSSPRVNIPLLKYNLPMMQEELAPLLATSLWTSTPDEITLSLDLSVNRTLEELNFYFPRITLVNSLTGRPDTITRATPVVQLSNGVLKWDRLDVGQEILATHDRLEVSWEPTPDCVPTPTLIEFELEGVVISGTDIVLHDSDSYHILTTVKKIKSGKYWTEPKIVES